VLNYGQSVFEGMKAQRSARGRIVLFRPQENAARMRAGGWCQTSHAVSCGTATPPVGAQQRVMLGAWVLRVARRAQPGVAHARLRSCLQSQVSRRRWVGAMSCTARAGAVRLSMPPPSAEMYVEAVTSAVRANAAWVPPRGKGALYLRPLLLGTGPILGLGPAPTYTLVVYAAAVGCYFKVRP
jgi:hypothetical protein